MITSHMHNYESIMITLKIITIIIPITFVLKDLQKEYKTSLHGLMQVAVCVITFEMPASQHSIV